MENSKMGILLNLRTLAFLVLAVGSLCSARAQQSHAELEGAEVRVYKHASDTDLKISILYPEDYDAKKKYPAIIFFFGGGWKGGSVQQFSHHCRYFASRGMIAMTADYRVMSRNGTTPYEAVEDARSALRWVKIHAKELGIHKKKIVAAGGSAGGHLALSTASIDDVNDAEDDLSIDPRPHALVLFNPVVNTMPEGYGFNAFEDSAGAKRLSPYHHINRKMPPTIIFHGDADTTVPLSNVQDLCRIMKENGRRCELLVYEGQKHAFFNYGRANHKYYILTVAAADRFLQSLGLISKREVVEIIP
jgi:acetyl esterase/lipase